MLHCASALFVHSPADLRWVKVRASQPGAVVLMKVTKEVDGLSRPERGLRETRDPPDLESKALHLLLNSKSTLLSVKVLTFMFVIWSMAAAVVTFLTVVTSVLFLAVGWGGWSRPPLRV